MFSLQLYFLEILLLLVETLGTASPINIVLKVLRLILDSLKCNEQIFGKIKVSRYSGVIPTASHHFSFKYFFLGNLKKKLKLTSLKCFLI